MKKVEARSVGEIMQSMMDMAGMTDEYERYRLCYLWSEVVGPAINRYTARRYIEGRTLHVHITSASLKNEISYLRPQLVRRLNDAVGKEVITDIMIH